MGTTADAVQGGGGRFCYVLAIEGFEKLLTTHDDLDAVVTAWAGTAWEAALPGLRIEGSIEQEIRPWTAEMSASSLKFIVFGDTDQDEFGEAVWKTTPTASSRLIQPFSGSTGTGSIKVQDTSAFTPGPIFIGPQRVVITNIPDSNTLEYGSGGVGTHAPFGSHGVPWQFPRGMPNFDPTRIGTFEPSVPPKVADVPRTWIGRWAGLWLHRVSGDVVDEQSEAELLFAGKIIDLVDAGAATVVEVEDLRGTIRDAVILQRQFTAHVKPGIRLYTGEFFRVDDGDGYGYSDDLVVVSSGAAGPNQIDSGFVDVGAFVAKLNEWMAAEYVATRLRAKWSVTIANFGEGMRVAIYREGWATNCALMGSNSHHARFLGFTREGWVQANGPFRLGEGSLLNSGLVAIGDEEPYRVKVVQLPQSELDVNGGSGVIELENTTGDWVENGDYLPHPFAAYRGISGDRGFIQLDEQQIIFAKHTSDTLFEELTFTGPISTLVTGSKADRTFGRRLSQEGPLVVRQLVFIGGTFSDVVTKLLASIEGNGENHPDFDAYPFGAGIPWKLLGDGWLNSVRSLEQANQADSIVIPLEKPTRLNELIASDVMLRFAFWVFKEGTLRLVSPPTPNLLTAGHTFDESNKGGPAGQRNDLRTASRVSKEFMRNTIKIQYDLKAERPSTFDVVDSASVADTGQSQALTIRARNAFSIFATTGHAINALAAGLVARAAPIFARPVRMFRRTINGTLFHVCPGDAAVLFDDFARDPTTGRRGISESPRAVTVLRTSIQWPNEGSEPFGEVDLMFWDEERTAHISATAEVDDTYSSGGFTSGWDAGNKDLKVKQHAHSGSSEDKDVTYFEPLAGVDRAVRIVEIDPTDPASADDFEDEVSAIDAATDVITLVNGFGAGGRPAFSASKRYRVTRPLFADVSALTERLAETFLADEGDGFITDESVPYTYAEDIPPDFSWTRNTGTEPFVNHVESALVEGRPLSAGLMRDLVRNSNALINYHTAYSIPFLSERENALVAAGSSYQWVSTFKVPAPYAPLPTGWWRKVTIAVRMKATGGGTAFARVTLAPTPPRGVTGSPIFDPPYAQLEFSTTSSSYVEVTEQEAVPPTAHGGFYYVTLEGKNATTSTSILGITRFQLGPLELIA